MGNGKILGIFDSGVGGLSVLKDIAYQVDYEKIIYFGDTARVPYGVKSQETICIYSEQDTQFLIANGASDIIVACGTANSNAIEYLRLKFSNKIIGVVEPLVSAALESSQSGNIGVIATKATIDSNIFGRLIKVNATNCILRSVACPLFVPLVEYGFMHSCPEIVMKSCEHYLSELKDANIDTLILGCTHYPFIADVINEFFGRDVKLISPGDALRKHIKTKTPTACTPVIEIYISDDAPIYLSNINSFLPNEFQYSIHKTSFNY